MAIELLNQPNNPYNISSQVIHKEISEGSEHLFKWL